jgi:acyl-coenzyme A thioesterase PaaI-like protein
MNDCLLVEGRVVKSGGKIAFLKADVYVKENDSFLLNEDKLVARGTHTKYVL